MGCLLLLAEKANVFIIITPIYKRFIVDISLYYSLISTRQGGLVRFSPAQYNFILLPDGS